MREENDEGKKKRGDGTLKYERQLTRTGRQVEKLRERARACIYLCVYVYVCVGAIRKRRKQMKRGERDAEKSEEGKR